MISGLASSSVDLDSCLAPSGGKGIVNCRGVRGIVEGEIRKCIFLLGEIDLWKV